MTIIDFDISMSVLVEWHRIDRCLNCSKYNQLESNILASGGVIVADAAFPLKPYTIPRWQFNIGTDIFNYQLSRAGRILENVFGILAS